MRYWILLVAVLGLLVFAVVVERRIRESEALVRRYTLLATRYPMQDVIFVHRETDGHNFAIVRQEGESPEAFAQRMAGITSGAIDPLATHLCAEVSGCSEGRSCTICIAILPGSTQQANEAALAELTAAVCAAIGCTVGCS